MHTESVLVHVLRNKKTFILIHLWNNDTHLFSSLNEGKCTGVTALKWLYYHSQVKIKLPDTKAAEVLLEVKERFLDLRTAK